MFIGIVLGFILCLVLVALYPPLGVAANDLVRMLWAWVVDGFGEHFGGPLTATADGTVSVAAHKLHLGLTTVTYAAVPAAVRALQPGVRYHIWCIDEHFSGGVQQWFAIRDKDVHGLDPGAVVAGTITIPLQDVAE